MFNKYIILIFIFVLSGCSLLTVHGNAYKKGKNAAKKGDYYISVLECVKSINAKPDYEKALILMDEVFPKFLDSYKYKINELSKQNNSNWDLIIKHQTNLIQAVKLIKDLESPKKFLWLNLINLIEYENELENTKKMAADYYYNKAINIAKKEDQESYKTAAKLFKRVKNYSKNYKDSDEMYELYKQKATKRLAILNFDNKSGTNKYGSIGEEISDDLISKILKDKELMEYIELVDRNQIQKIIKEQKLSQSGIIQNEHEIKIGEILGVQYLITGKVSRIQVSPVDKISENQTLKKKVITKYEYYEDKNGKEKKRPIKEDVFAYVKIYKVSRTANISVSLNIVDTESSKVLFSYSANEEFNYKHEWATYTGNKKALNYNVKKLIKAKSESAPSEGTMISKLSNRVTKKLKRELKSNLN